MKTYRKIKLYFQTELCWRVFSFLDVLKYFYENRSDYENVQDFFDCHFISQARYKEFFKALKDIYNYKEESTE